MKENESQRGGANKGSHDPSMGVSVMVTMNILGRDTSDSHDSTSMCGTLLLVHVYHVEDATHGFLVVASCCC